MDDAFDERPPRWANEPVLVVPYDPRWPGVAARFAREVADLFVDRLVGDVAHVGSTAVPGLAAKPIIDLQALCADPEAVLAEVGDAAAVSGWHHVPRELDRRPWRWLFVRVTDDERSRLAHLHLMPPGEGRWEEQLLFRDRLRSNPHLRAEYERVKHGAAAAHPEDREAYGDAKTTFVLDVLDGRAV